MPMQRPNQGQQMLENKGRKSSSCSTASKHSTSDQKKNILIAGDSLLRDIKGWMMSRQSSVKVHSFRGEDTRDMHFHIQPLINKKPDKTILYISTNDLNSGLTPEEISEKVLNLTKRITDHGTECAVSSIVIKGDELWEIGKTVNSKIQRELEGFNVDFISHNIEIRHLNSSRIHLNRFGVPKLATNFINYIKERRI